jgi:hypothetical protein
MMMPSGEWEDLLRERRAEESRQIARRRLAREAKAEFQAQGAHPKGHILRFSMGAGRGVLQSGSGGVGKRLALLIDSLFSIWRHAAGGEWDGVAAECSGCGEGHSSDLRGGL